jgi:hypothetical protein
MALNKVLEKDLAYLRGCLDASRMTVQNRNKEIAQLQDEIARLRAALTAAEERATAAEATLATIGGADKATLARKLRRANTQITRLRAIETAAEEAIACWGVYAVLTRTPSKDRKDEDDTMFALLDAIRAYDPTFMADDAAIANA